MTGFLAESAPYELIDGEMGEQQDHISTIAKEVMDRAWNLSLLHSEMSDLYGAA